MPYQEIALELIDPNPFQTREEYPVEVATGIATSAMDRHGLLQPPMVRPHGKRFQLAFGHGRIKALRGLGKTETTCRVEDLTDAEMKKYVLVENVNRRDLSEDERMTALEQYREELGITPGESGFVREMSTKTGIPETTISTAYSVKRVRNLLKSFPGATGIEASFSVIRETRGLEEEDRVKLVVKATERGWSGQTTATVKTAVKDMNEEVRSFILEDETKLTPKTILALKEIDPSKQLETAQYIRTFKLNESLALSLIERVKTGEGLVLDVKRIDEAQSVIDGFTSVLTTISLWGYNQYWILYSANRWEEAQAILEKIEEKARWVREASYARKEVESDVQSST